MVDIYSISEDIPTFEVTQDDLENLICFLYKKESLLKEYGGIKLIPNHLCKQSFKKRRFNRNSPSNFNVQKVKQINETELIYSIDFQLNKKFHSNQLLNLNEKLFWESLSNSEENNHLLRPNFKIYPNKSFYSSRSNKNCFNLLNLPKMSLLKIGGSQILNECLPILYESDGIGTISPLSTGDHRLFSIDYHHFGGDRQFYLIPHQQILKLKQIFQSLHLSLCLEHQNLLINPSFLHKYSILFYKTLQKANEFVILSSGTFSQGFSYNSSINERIDFALPIWFDDGHANQQLALCDCSTITNHLPKPIDIKLFRYEIVQRWINKHIKSNLIKEKQDTNNNNNRDRNSIQTQTDLLDDIDQLSMDTNSIQFFSQLNQQNLFSSNIENPIISNLLPTPISNYTSHDQYKQISIEKPIETNENTSIDLNEEYSSNQLMDLLPNTNLNNQKQQFPNCRKKGQSMNCFRRKEGKELSNTLYVSSLKSDVTKKDLYKHFLGARKITIKRHQMPPFLKYAFIVHRSSIDSQRNVRRTIDRNLFGNECHIEYFDQNYHNHFGQQPFTIVVTQIPEDVNKDQLNNLFVHCQSFKYYPGRPANLIEHRSTNLSKNKILLGYAFIRYSNNEQVNNVIENSQFYQINGQQLNISLYNNNKYSIIKTK